MTTRVSTPTIACAADINHLGGYFQTLKRQVAACGLPFVVQVIDDFSWAALVEWELAFCRKHAGQRVVFVDAEDFLMQGSVEELEAALHNEPLLFHAEARCWPEPQKLDLYPKPLTDSPYRFVNGTGPAGECDMIADAIEWGLKNCPIRGREASIFADNDQRMLTDIYLSGRGEVDEQCNLSVQLNAVGPEDFTLDFGRLRLNWNNATPVFVHCNGASRKTYGAILDRLAAQ